MSRYVFAYHGGGMAATPEEQEASMAAWGRWFGEIGEALIDGGAPVAAAKTVTEGGTVVDGGGANPISGYSIVEASDLDAAVVIAKGCPLLSDGGSVEVAEAIDMG